MTKLWAEHFCPEGSTTKLSFTLKKFLQFSKILRTWSVRQCWVNVRNAQNIFSAKCATLT